MQYIQSITSTQPVNISSVTEESSLKSLHSVAPPTLRRRSSTCHIGDPDVLVELSEAKRGGESHFSSLKHWDGKSHFSNKPGVHLLALVNFNPGKTLATTWEDGDE
jgi:hypothetical protein